jgi:hypothetical protein
VVDEADVGEIPLRHAIADDAVIVQRLLDADQVHVRPFSGGGDEEPPLPRPDLDDDGVGVSEPPAEVESMESRVPRIEDKVCVIHARGAPYRTL